MNNRTFVLQANVASRPVFEAQLNGGQRSNTRMVSSATGRAAALPLRDSVGQRVKRVKPARAPGTGRTWLRQKTGLVLIEVSKDGAGGFPCRYCKGQLLPYYVAKGWKALDDGQLEANLERHFTEQGRDYFATDAGRAELAQLVNYIRTHSAKTQGR
ncbi:hypothetical protein [Rhodoferax sp.]|uniref:hypothetical protein n=1 Tax=Rhodoferax sp. TaxID=50421 RepID=UPI0039B9D095